MKIQEESTIHKKHIGAVVLEGGNQNLFQFIQPQIKEMCRLISDLEFGISFIQTCIITPRFKSMSPEKSGLLWKNNGFIN